MQGSFLFPTDRGPEETAEEGNRVQGSGPPCTTITPKSDRQQWIKEKLAD